MTRSFKTVFTDFLTKAIVFNCYLYALGLFTSKALTSISGVLVIIFGLIQLMILRKNPLKLIEKRTINPPFLFFTFALLLSMIGHPVSSGFSEIRKHILIFFFFYITISNLHNFKQIKNILLLSVISMGIAAIYGIYQHFFLHYPRVEGFATPLGFGCLLAIFILFTLVYGLWGKLNLGYRVTSLFGTIFLSANLLFTQSRGAWLAFLGGVFTLSWFKTKKMLLFVVIICLVLYSFLPQVYRDRFNSSFDIKTNFSNLERLALWKASLLMYRDHYIKGVGMGRFEEELITNYMQPNLITTCHAHSNIFQFMAENGTLGLVGFIWLMAAIVIWLYKNYQRLTDHNWKLFLLASLCGVIVFNIQGLTEVNYGDAETIRFFWFLMAINAAIIKLNQNDAAPREQLTSN